MGLRLIGPNAKGERKVSSSRKSKKTDTSTHGESKKGMARTA